MGWCMGGWINGWINGWVSGWGHVTKNQINLELIKIIQFCLKMGGWVD